MSKQNFEVNIEFNKTDIINKQLCLVFDIKLVNFSNEKIDNDQLLEKLNRLIPKTENKYISIKNHNTKSVIYVFDADKWFGSKTKLIETENRYVKRLILNKLPTMILNNVNSVDYTRVVEESFRNYLTKNKELKEKISNSVAENLPFAYYRFEYDGNLNTMKIEVKEEFRHNIMAILKSKKNPRKQLKKMDFDSSVETFLKFAKKKRK